MRTTALKSSEVCLLLSVLALGSTAVASDIVLQKVPPLTVEQAPSYPQNLARYHLGAQVEAAPESRSPAAVELSSKTEDRNAAEAALLCDDPTIGYGLSNGSTTLVISLPNIENIDTVSFLNTGAKGTVSIATSNTKLPVDSPQWHPAAQQELSPDAVKAKVGPAEAKYLKIVFNVENPGRIYGFGAYSTPAASDFTMPRPRKVKLTDESQTLGLITSSLTDVHAKARALYVSSGTEVKQANNMIDAQPATAYSFAADDATPTAIIDLGKESKLRRLSATYSPQPGTIEFYVLQSLPSDQQAKNLEVKTSSPQTGLSAVSGGGTPMPNTYTLSDSDAANMKAVGSVTASGADGRAAVDFPETTGRYVMVKWIPASHEKSFAITEVAAFGGAGKKQETIAEEDDRFQGTQVADGKTMIESKDVPAEGPAEPPGEGPPPNLPPPPPFTFIPEVVPTSP